MTAVVLDNVSVATGRGARQRPVRTATAMPRARAAADPRVRRRATVLAPVPAMAPVNSCRVSRPRPRVTIVESSAIQTAGWQLTERGWAVVVLGISAVFGSGVWVAISQFLAVTAG